MKFDAVIPVHMLAPCGMNCAVCYVHLKKKKACQGCRGQEGSQPNHCRTCSIRNCTKSRSIDFCFECQFFPCAMIERLDKSYRQRYQVSLVENALRIKTVGVTQHLKEEQQKWTCIHCGCVISLHDGICSECGRDMG